jgi:hypothetical protein
MSIKDKIQPHNLTRRLTGKDYCRLKEKDKKKMRKIFIKKEKNYGN